MVAAAWLLAFADSVLEDGRQMQVTAVEIFVHTLPGMIITLDCVVSDTIDSVQAEIQSKAGIPTNLQHMLHPGSQLEDGRQLSDYQAKHFVLGP